MAITHSYDLTGITNRPTDEQINDFINEYNYVFPFVSKTKANSEKALWLIGSSDPINYEVNDNQFFLIKNEIDRLNNHGVLFENNAWFDNPIDLDLYSYISTEIGEPNTAEIYYTYGTSEVVVNNETGSKINSLDIGNLLKNSHYATRLFVENVSEEVKENISIDVDYSNSAPLTTVEFSLDESFSNPARYLKFAELHPNEEVPFFVRVKTYDKTPTGDGEVILSVKGKE